jgi:hypothetical protein
MAATAVGLGSPPARAISINPRSSWATDRPPKGPLDPEDVRFLIAHHSASRNGHTSADAPSILRSFYDFHTGDKGWNDIAYNFLIDSGGGIWEGRAGSLDGPVAGDATGGNQGFTQLVCVIGDYNAAQPTRASLTALVSLLAWLSDRYSIVTDPGSAVTFVSRGSNKWPAGSSVTTPTIIGHRAMSQTTCPGTNLNNYVVGSLMADVTAARGGQPVSPTTQPATTTAAVPAPTADSSSTTTSVPSTTALFETTTRVAAPTSTAGPTTSIGSVATTTPVAVGTPSTISAPTPDAASTVSPLIAGAAGVAALATGLVAWRFRRLSGKHLP